ncbi:MAG: hypothetical protein B0D92_08540 [Spirochaeta sp. LUC14_002_19_P3]|nr:MAG: hypothetical protein B0D92_08540 [Spirochaeta sp. LUC14_002_19_P3]
MEQLIWRLNQARTAYYSTSSPLMSDAEFDALEEELRRLAPHHPYFTQVGYIIGEGEKITHRVPLLSMGKAKDLSEVEKWLRRLEPQADWKLTVQPKIDGLSATLLYKNGQLRYIATRGDGISGQNISHIAGYIKDIPQTIPFTREPVEVRGELHLPRDTALDTGGRPLRNNCVGLINRKDSREELAFVRFLAYQIVWPQSAPENSPSHTLSEQHPRLVSESGKIDLLRECHFYTFDTWPLSASQNAADETARIDSFMEQIRGIYQNYIGSLRDTWNFETDGLIIVVDNTSLHAAIDSRWVVDHHHHYALAFKPPPQAAQTALIEVIWQVSRQGNLTPVARFKPITLGGASLERASLHNAANVRRLKLSPGDTIVVERANDVIPYVRENLKASQKPPEFQDSRLWPQSCPSCASLLTEEGVNILCPNPSCRGRILQTILYWVRQTGMEQIALRTLEMLYDAGKIRSIRDIYSLKAEDFAGLEGFGDKKTANFLEQAAARRSMSPAEFISRLGIPMVQEKSLARLGISTIEDFMAFDDSTYATGRGIIDWKSEPANLELLQQLLEAVSLTVSPAPAAAAKGALCLTGKAPLPRKELTAALNKLGWTVTDTVTRETTRLICDNPGGTSAKLKKARELGMEILTYEEFLGAEGIIEG